VKTVLAPFYLLGLDLPQLSQWAQSQGQPAYRGQQLHSAIYRQGLHSLEQATSLPQSWREHLRSVAVGRSQIYKHIITPDKTRKYLLRLADGQVIETVGIPTSDRLTVCVSSQVGCPMGCDFCATGKGGWQRHLAVHEIVDQVLTVQEDFQRRVNHVVFMGMGEPLLNLDQVLGAVRCLNQDVGIGMRSVTISTVGLRHRIRELAQHHLQATLAVSLHASNQEIRDRLIPSSRSYPLTELLSECREYVAICKRRVTFEYILLAGLNDQPEHAAELAGHLRGFQSHVNLIPYNPIAEVSYRRPNRQRIETFRQTLAKHHIAVSVRQTRGLEADAACGQLRASAISQPVDC